MKIKGFTFLELLITLSIVMILSIIGIASYSSLIQKNELQVIEDELRVAIDYAKIQSIMLEQTVSLSPLTSSLNWAEGAKLSVLNKKTGELRLLHQWQWQHSRWSIAWRGVRSSSSLNFSNHLTHAISNGQFSVVNLDTQQEVTMVLNRLGRVRVKSV
jgi:Tfp pilus assembly protein FimT